MGEKNGRKKEKKKCTDHVRKKWKNKIGERVGEWIFLINICEYFHSPKLFGYSGEAIVSDFF
jgi:hypothetical protein